MSRIADLISHHCPNGVDYLRISDLGDFISGLKGKTKADFADGNAKFVSYKNVFDNIEVDFSDLKSVRINVGERQTSLRRGDLIFTSSSENLDESGMTSVVTTDLKEDIFLNSFCFFVHLPESIKPEFAKYLFRSTGMRKQIIKCANGVTRYNISKKALAKIKFPVPPLEVQNEIVRILDSFTELEAELEAGLEARRKQYEYYRDSLLKNVRNSEEKSIADLIIDVKSGKSKKSDWAEDGLFPLFGSTGKIATTNRSLYSGSAILIARVGAYAGKVYVVDGDYGVSDNALIMHPNPSWNLRYAFHQLTAINLRNLAKGGGQPLVTGGDLKKMVIKVPPLSEQERIVAILDKFDALVNDLSSGLPAEIAARRKQYEYYRDRLLVFTPSN